jgi:serine/threonine protein kinase
MPLGSLSSYISKNKKMPWPDRYQIMADISEGMAFLHSNTQENGKSKQELFHQDLKSGNVLLTVWENKLRGKISDFGLAFLREMSTDGASSNVQLNGGTKSYQAPELFKRNAKFNKKADVFAAGIVFLEIIAQRGPIDLMVFPFDSHNSRINCGRPYLICLDSQKLFRMFCVHV